jgi:hypothetical protein
MQTHIDKHTHRHTNTQRHRDTQRHTETHTNAQMCALTRARTHVPFKTVSVELNSLDGLKGRALEVRVIEVKSLIVQNKIVQNIFFNSHSLSWKALV